MVSGIGLLPAKKIQLTSLPDPVFIAEVALLGDCTMHIGKCSKVGFFYLEELAAG